MTPASVVLVLCLSVLALGGCGGKLPEARRSYLTPPLGSREAGTTLVMQSSTTENACTDGRIA